MRDNRTTEIRNREPGTGEKRETGNKKQVRGQRPETADKTKQAPFPQKGRHGAKPAGKADKAKQAALPTDANAQLPMPSSPQRAGLPPENNQTPPAPDADETKQAPPVPDDADVANDDGGGDDNFSLADCSMDDLESLAADDLRDLCRREGLESKGKKDDLFRRLYRKKTGRADKYVGTLTKCKYCGTAIKVKRTDTIQTDGRTIITRQVECTGKHHHRYKLVEIVEPETEK